MSRSRSPLLGSERRTRIIEILSDRGKVRISELCELFGVADETIRRDLKQLKVQGLLERSHGGAISFPAREESTFLKRLQEQRTEKAAIARYAASLVQDGSTIIIDSGTTMAHFAERLKGKHDLVVVTNAVTNAWELMEGEDATVVLTGGVVRRTTLGAVGDLAVNTIQDLHVDQTFLAIQSVSVKAGLTYPSFEEVAIKRAMIAAAREVILLADSSKFGRESLVKVAPLAVLTRIVTTPGISAEMQRQIAELGIDLIVVEPNVADAADYLDPVPALPRSLQTSLEGPPIPARPFVRATDFGVRADFASPADDRATATVVVTTTPSNTVTP